MQNQEKNIKKECLYCKKTLSPLKQSKFCSKPCAVKYYLVGILDFIFPRY